MNDIQLEDYPKDYPKDSIVQDQPIEEDDGFTNQSAYGEKYDAKSDQRDMYRLGKQQDLKRRFRYFSIAGYVVILGSTWEYAIIASTFGLANGGPAGAIWMSIIVIVGMFLGVLSLAEVASMAPTSGGQYHWVSEIAPRSVQQPLSYIVGWLALIGWQVFLPGNAYIFSQQILALISLCRGPSYVSQGWQASLITIGSACAAIALSVFVVQKLTIAEGLAVATNCFGFVAFIIILWVMGPGADAHETFFDFQNQSGWASPGVATLVGIIGPVATFIGGDSAVHLAEELQDASYVLPRAMVAGCAINYVVGLIALITFIFNVGPIDDSLMVYGGQPWVAVMYRITGSKAATIVLLVLMSICLFWLQVNCVMTSSRQLWAFARDKGLPYHGFLARVTDDGLPRNAVVVTLIFAIVLSLIVIGSTAAFNIFTSIGGAGLMTSYAVVIGCIIYRRFDGGVFPSTKFSLGRYGLAINAAAFSYLLVALVFCFFPAVPDPTLAEMNWASLMFGTIVLLSFGWYAMRARFEYDGPVEYVRKNL